MAWYLNGEAFYFSMDQYGLDELRANTNFNSSLPTTFWCMGYGSDVNEYATKLAIKSYAALTEMNFIVLITSELFSDPEILPVDFILQKSNYAYFVGKIFAEFIHKFVLQSFVPDDLKIHIVGFSFGAEVAGVTGTLYYQISNRKIRRISGVDPPGICFFPYRQLLNTESGICVDVYHNSIAYVGTSINDGHLNVYMNNIIEQPGCDGNISCNHRRGVEYWVESLFSKDC